MKALSIFLTILSLNSFLVAQKPSVTREPQLVSVFPIGGQQGMSFDVEVRGQSLEGAYGVWFDCENLKAEIKRIEEIELDEANPQEPKDKTATQGYRVWVRVEVVPTSPVGGHSFRLLSAGGVSNPLTLRVYAEPVVAEVGVPHQLPGDAQTLRFPGVVSGRISKMGEVDLYAVDTLAGQELLFEALAGSAVLDPYLTLYESTGSWFDSHRPTRLAFDDEPRFQKKTTNARLTYRFNRKGRYLIAVGTFDGRGGLDYCYQLRIVPLAHSISSEIERESFPKLAHREPQDWREREFGRNLEAERLQILSSRTVRIPNKDKAMTGGGSVGSLSSNRLTSYESHEDGDSSASVPIVTRLREKEPNDTFSQASEVSVPVTIEGTIEHPKDVDFFKFRVKAGERLAFEIETPNAVPPQFNPRLAISDTDGNVILTNIYKTTLEPKTVYTFERAGEYCLQIRDLTFRYGGPDFIYRVLIRPQIAHMGEVKISDDRINLRRGEAKKLSVVTEQEEGFDGEIALAVENLPPGVQSFPATEVEPDRVLPQEDLKKQWFVPKRQRATIVLLTSKEAPLTTQPWFACVTARPIVQGKPGMPVSSRQIPLMVVAEAEGAKWD